MEKSLDWGFITLIVIGVLGVLLAFGIIRMWRSRKPQHSVRKERLIIPFSGNSIFSKSIKVFYFF